MTRKKKPESTSNNPRGRPKAGEAFTEILRAELDKVMPDASRLHPHERRLRAKHLVAQRVAQAMVHARVEMEPGRFLVFRPEEWVRLVQWAISQTDKTLLDPEGPGFQKAYFVLGPDDL